MAVLFAVLSGVSYGASDFAGGLASKRNNAFLVTFVVQLVSVASLAVVLMLSAPAIVTTVDLGWGALAGVGATIGLTTFYKALADGPMSTAASVTALVGSLVPVLTGLALGEVPNGLTLIGIAVAIPSGIIVSAGGVGSARLRFDETPRDRARRRFDTANTRRLSIIAGLGFGLFFVAVAQASADAGLYPLVGARFVSVVGLALLLTARKTWGVPHRADWTALVVAGVLDCSANSFYVMALDGASFTWVAAVVSLYPVATVLLARLILAERITRPQLVGLAGALVALFLVGVGAS